MSGLIQPDPKIPKLNFRVYETMGSCTYSEWAMSKIPPRLKAIHDWTPFSWLFKPLHRVGILRPYFDRGERGYNPKWIYALTYWRPLASWAHRRWVRKGKPGLLEKVDFT